MSGGREVPAREVPPIDWPLEKKMLSRRKWLEQQGGTQLRDSGQKFFPFKDLSPGEDDREKAPYREHFDPPLKNVDAESVPPDDVPHRIHDYHERFVENGDFLDVCEHLTDRELLRWIEELTKTEFELVHGTGSGVFQLDLSCPDCVREMERDEGFVSESTLLERLQKKFDGIERKLEEQQTALESTEELFFDAWPPGSNRLRLLCGASFRRLQSDVESNAVPVFDGEDELVLDVLDGLRALDWVLGGLEQQSEGKENQALETLRGAGRMIRIINNRPAERHPGSFYGDLETLISDLEFIQQLLVGDDSIEKKPLAPDPDVETPEKWAEYFREVILVDYPSFEEFFREGVSEGVIRRTHQRWERREQYWDVEDKKSRRMMQSFLGRSAQFDPDRPDKFLDGDVQPVEPETVEPGQYSNSELMALTYGRDEAISPERYDELSRTPQEPDEDSPVDKAKNDPVHEELTALYEKWDEIVYDRKKSEIENEIIPIVRYLIRFADHALDRSYDFRWEFEDHDWGCCIRGAYRFGESIMEDVLEVLSEQFAEGAASIRQKVQSIRLRFRESDPLG